jgi:hypothetical protein
MKRYQDMALVGVGLAVGVFTTNLLLRDTHPYPRYSMTTLGPAIIRMDNQTGVLFWCTSTHPEGTYMDYPMACAHTMRQAQEQARLLRGLWEGSPR